MRPRCRNAFTLIELLVVIVILGILMAVAVPTFLRQQSKAQDSRTQQYLTTAFKAIRASTPTTGNAYPSSTSMVSWVQQSEPELTAQRGSCTTQVQSAPQDAVLVDPSSTSNALTLCARSQSGNVWKLTASATGVQQLLDGTLIPLTFTGNEITDTTRAAGVQGDGLANDSSTGVWETTTNIVTNGGFESGTSGWTTIGAGTMSWTTSQAKFGSHSINVGFTGPPSADGVRWTVGAVSAGTTYTATAWVNAPASSVGTQLNIRLRDSTGAQQTVGKVLTAGWQRIQATWTTPNAATLWLDIYDSVGAGHAWNVYVDGVQLEQKAIATPYVETNGSSASRGTAVIKGPSSLFNVNQGWIAIRIRPEWASTSYPHGGSGWEQVWNWGENGGNDELGIQYVEAGGRWEFKRDVNNVGNARPNFTVPVSAGVPITLIAYWTPTNDAISLNGAAFHTAAGSLIGPLSTSTFALGNADYASGEELDGEILWFAGGSGTLTDADAATINSWGNTDPSRSQFPTAAQATMVWNGVSTSGSLK